MELNGDGEVIICGSFLREKRKVMETSLTLASDGCKVFSLPLKISRVPVWIGDFGV